MTEQIDGASAQPTIEELQEEKKRNGLDKKKMFFRGIDYFPPTPSSLDASSLDEEKPISGRTIALIVFFFWLLLSILLAK